MLEQVQAVRRGREVRRARRDEQPQRAAARRRTRRPSGAARTRLVGRSTGVRCATPPDPGLPAAAAADVYSSEPAERPRSSCGAERARQDNDGHAPREPHRPLASRCARAIARWLASPRCLAALRCGGCGTGHPRPIAAGDAGRSADVPVLPPLLGRAAASSATRSPRPTGRRATSARVGDSVYYGDCVKRQRDLRRRQLRAAAAGHDGHLPPALQRDARATAQHRRARRPGDRRTTKVARSSSTAGASRSTCSPNTFAHAYAAALARCGRSTRPARRAATCRRRSTAPAWPVRRARSSSA